VDWLTVFVGDAALIGVLPITGWIPPVQPAGQPSAEWWTDHDLDIVRLVYETLTERSVCGRCGMPLRRVVLARPVRGAYAAPRILVSVRCRSWRRHRQVAEVADRRGELRFGELRPT
jgi:hypothetical protein